MNIFPTLYKYLITAIVTLAILLVTSQSSSGKNFYFSNSIGDDTRTTTQAQSSTTPWKSISKLNSIFTSLLPGDSVLFKRGEVFYGSINVTKSGTSTQPIIISAYGSGQKPIISGFSSLSSWTSIGNGIYQCAATACNTTVNMVTVNGVQKAIGRYPNTGYLKFESHVGTTSITDNELTGTPNWTGAEVVIKKRRFHVERNTITNHTGSTINYISSSTYEPIDGFGYFIQNDPKTLDQFGEWYYNDTNKSMRMYFGTNNPSSYSVKASSLDTLFFSKNFNYINCSDLKFEGANNTCIKLTNSDYIVFKNCLIDFSGVYGFYAGGGTSYLVIDNCEINHSNSIAFFAGSWAGVATTNTFTNNRISNTGMIPGMGENEDGNYEGIRVFSDNSLIEYNIVDTTGYVGIQFDGNNTKVRNNLINNFCSVIDDGGGIYSYRYGYSTQIGQEITNNIIINGIGSQDGINPSSIKLARGIYIDGNSQNLLISNNTMSNCNDGGLFLGWYVRNLIIKNNIMFDNRYQLWSQRHAGEIPNFTIENNIFFAKTITQKLVFIDGISPAEYGSVDYNYLCRPINEDNSFYVYSSPSYLDLNIAEWRSAYGKDLNSKISPISITNVDDIFFNYNATKVNKTVALPYQYIGVDGTLYNNSLTLLPYTSIVLIKSPTSINLPPVIKNQTFQTSKNSSNGAIVGTIIASDPNAGQSLTFSILSGNTNGAFTLNSVTGVITIANSSALSLQTSNIFSLIVKVQDNGTGILSSQATITVNLSSLTGCSATGNISYQIWNNIGSGVSVASLTSNINYPNNPSSSTLITSMEGTTNLADLFGARIAGYLCAPATGSYTFWIASDDNSELWLSTDDKSANKQLIAYNASFTLSREWNKYSTQKSATVNLIQGYTYYIEALMKEGSGGDNLAVGWLKPGQTGTVPSEVIPGSVLSPIVIKSIEIKAENSVLPDFLNVKLSLFPNPLGNNELNIKIENLFSEATLKIFSISGVECLSELIPSSGIIHIDRNTFKSGMYIVKVFNDRFIKTSKLIVR